MWGKYEGTRVKTLRDTTRATEKRSDALVAPRLSGARIGHAVPRVTYTRKRVSFKNKQGEWSGCVIDVKLTTYIVWNGHKWVTQAEWNQQFPRK